MLSQEKTVSSPENKEADPRLPMRNFILKILNPNNKDKEGYHDEAIDLTREQRREFSNGTPEQRALAEKYKKSKFRNNWFASVFGIIETMDNSFPELANNQEFIELSSERKNLMEDFKKLDTAHNGLITKEMIDRADILLKKAADLLSK